MGFNSAFKGLTFNNCSFCPHCIYAFCIYLRTNIDLCHLQHKLIVFYNPDKSVHSAIRTGSLNKAVCLSFLKGQIYAACSIKYSGLFDKLMEHLS